MLRSYCLVATSVLAITVGTANATAFNVTGSGTIPMGGTLTINTITGAVGPEDVTVPNPPNTTGLDFTNLTSSVLGSGSTWDITLNQGVIPGYNLLLILPVTTLVGYPGGTILETDLYQTGLGPESGLTCRTGTCGSLTASTTPVPLPATLSIFTTGLGALGLLGWRRKRKAVG